MNILQVNSGKGWSGGQYHVLLLSKGLQKRGHQVMIACSPGSALAEKAGAEGIQVVPVPMRGQLDLRAIFALRKILRQYRIDVVNSHKPLPHTLIWLAATGLNIPIVTTRHVTFPLPAHPFRQLKWNYATHKIIAVCQAVADTLKASGIPAGHIEVIYCPLDTERFLAGIPGRSIREEFGIEADAPVVGQVGDLRYWKGFDDFISAAALILKEIPNARMLAVGRKSEAYDGLLRLCKDLGIDDRIHFTGFRSDIEKCYAAMTVCVSSSTAGEAAPYALKEPLAMGVPVVATRVGGNGEVVIEGQTGFLVPPRTPRAMADAVLRLLNDLKLRKSMGQKGQQDVKNRFSLDGTIAQTEAVYRDAVKQN